MKIMYLTWGETPRSYGVYASQVIRQFVANSLADNTSTYSFVAGVPLINSSLIREGRRYKDELLNVQTALGDIELYRIPIFAPQNFVLSSRFTFNMLHWFAHARLVRLIDKLRPDIIHARSYHATYAALEVKRKYGLTFKVIFDARGLWPEEIAWKKGYTRDSLNYSFLKDLEFKLLNESDVCVSVSETMEEELRKVTDFNSALIYSSADTSKLSTLARTRTEEHSHSKRKIVLCYIGAIGEDTWHSATQLGALYKHIVSLGFDVSLKLITTSNHQNLRRILSYVPTDKLMIKSTKSTDELVRELADVDIGVLPYRANTTYFESLIGKSIVGTKTTEYLSAKLPILVNQNCEGAARIARKYQVGISYDSSTFLEITQDSIYNILNIDEEKFSEISYEYFSYEKNSKRYCNIYREVI